MRGRIRLLPFGAAVGVLLALAGAAPDSLGQARPRPRRARVFAPPPAALDHEQARGRELMGLFLRQGLKQRYSGEQVTRLFMGGVPETRQAVRYDGPGRLRMEYLSPERLRGEIILITGGRIFQYKPPENRILDGVAPPEEFQARAREFMQGVRAGRIQLRVVGEEEIAGRTCSIVEIRSVGGGAFYLRFWIDQQTGVRLRVENRDPQGRPVSETVFTKVEYGPQDAASFRPNSLPNVPHVPRLPDSPPLASVQAARALVNYAIREPAVPTGFQLNGVWVVTGRNGRKTTILRYTDGVNTFALFESPAHRPAQAAATPPPRRFLARNGVAHWSSGDLAFALIGHLRPENVRLIADSLSNP